MKIGLIFAMEEEAVLLKDLFTNIKQYSYPFFPISTATLNNIEFISIVSGIGKVAAATGCLILIEKFNVDAVINIGSCGGLNCNIGDIVLSNTAFYHDVDVTGFGYKKGQLPGNPDIFTSSENIFNFNKLLSALNTKNVINGVVATGDQFINNINTVQKISNMHKNIKSLEMEAAAIAQVCKKYNKDFLLVKKVSDLADDSANHSFKSEIINFNVTINSIIKTLITTL